MEFGELKFGELKRHRLLHHWILSKEDWTSIGDTIAILWIRACLYGHCQWTANRSFWPNIKGWRRRFQGFKVSRPRPDVTTFKRSSLVDQVPQNNRFCLTAVHASVSTAPVPYIQFVTIHSLYHGHVIPFVFSLLTGQTVGLYRQLFKHVRGPTWKQLVVNWDLQMLFLTLNRPSCWLLRLNCQERDFQSVTSTSHKVFGVMCSRWVWQASTDGSNESRTSSTKSWIPASDTGSSRQQADTPTDSPLSSVGRVACLHWQQRTISATDLECVQRRNVNQNRQSFRRYSPCF